MRSTWEVSKAFVYAFGGCAIALGMHEVFVA
jgi:hypothetical protein